MPHVLEVGVNRILTVVSKWTRKKETENSLLARNSAPMRAVRSAAGDIRIMVRGDSFSVGIEGYSKTPPLFEFSRSLKSQGHGPISQRLTLTERKVNSDRQDQQLEFSQQLEFRMDHNRMRSVYSP